MILSGCSLLSARSVLVALIWGNREEHPRRGWGSRPLMTMSFATDEISRVCPGFQRLPLSRKAVLATTYRRFELRDGDPGHLERTYVLGRGCGVRVEKRTVFDLIGRRSFDASVERRGVDIGSDGNWTQRHEEPPQCWTRGGLGNMLSVVGSSRLQTPRTRETPVRPLLGFRASFMSEFCVLGDQRTV